MAAQRLVVFVVYDDMQLLDVAGPAEVFNSATALLRGKGGYRLLIASPHGKPVRSGSGLRLDADIALADLHEPVDTVVVAGGWGYNDPAVTAAVVPALVALAPRTRRMTSVCSGAFLLAEAGLLNGRTATTHWALCRELTERFPAVTVQPDRIFVREGAVFTSAGVTAGMDLALALVESDHDAALARQIARWLVLFLQRPGGQTQFSARLDHPVPSGSVLRVVLDAIVADPSADHRADLLAARAGVSERHLRRLFESQAGTTPARFVERARVEAARDLLERTALPVDTVASRCGFGSDETLRRAFRRVLGTGPAEYRDRFRSTDVEEMACR